MQKPENEMSAAVTGIENTPTDSEQPLVTSKTPYSKMLIFWGNGRSFAKLISALNVTTHTQIDSIARDAFSVAETKDDERLSEFSAFNFFVIFSPFILENTPVAIPMVRDESKTLVNKIYPTSLL